MTERRTRLIVDTVWNGEDSGHLAREELLAEVARLKAELEQARELASGATAYRTLVPEGGGTDLLVQRQGAMNGSGWAVSVPGRGGGRAWTAEGWQESISAMSVDRLFCWPSAAVAIAEARSALAA